MSIVSSRYAWSLCFAILPVFGVVILHSYIGLQADDCSGAARVNGGHPTFSSSAAVQGMYSTFDAIDVQEGSISMPASAARLRFAIVRSFDAKKLYHHPEVAFVRHAAPTGRGLDWIIVDGEKLPIHRAYYSTRQSSIFVGYVLIYQSQPVSNPYWTQFRYFPEQLFSGRRPTTLLFISGTGTEAEQDAVHKRAVEWLTGAWLSHKSICKSR